MLQVGEECDVAGGASWCNNCQISFSNPGENPVTSIWLTIPRLTNSRLGTSWDNSLPFSDVRMVVGRGTNLFTLGDTVGFGMKTEYRLPIMIPADKVFCLSSTGASLSNQKICTQIANGLSLSNTGIQVFTRPTDGKKYVVLGSGDFQYQPTVGAPYLLGRANSTPSVSLFRGAGLYSTPVGATVTLRDAFK